VHLVAHHVDVALDEGVIRHRNTVGTARRTALYDHTHGTQPLLVTGVVIPPAALRCPDANTQTLPW
jgi:hypothetical protein